MVYIDNALNPFGRMLMSHMHADTLEELHVMADAIGLRRRWFQDTKLPHYDVCQSKKLVAVELGAKSVTTREIIKLMRKQ